MNLTALIFDVDGTLAETEEAHRQAFNEIFDEAGLGWNWSVEDYTRLLRTTGGKERMRAHREDISCAEPSDDRIAELHARKTVRYGEIVASGDLRLAERNRRTHRGGAAQQRPHRGRHDNEQGKCGCPLPGLFWQFGRGPV